PGRSGCKSELSVVPRMLEIAAQRLDGMAAVLDLLSRLRKRLVRFARSREDLHQSKRKEQRQRQRHHELDQREAGRTKPEGAYRRSAHFRSAIRSVVLTMRRRVSD